MKSIWRFKHGYKPDNQGAAKIIPDVNAYKFIPAKILLVYSFLHHPKQFERGIQDSLK